MKTFFKHNAGNRTAFTLMEMLVVIVIVAILATILSGAYIQAQNHTKRARAEMQLREIVKAWNEYYQMYSNWPSAVMNVNGGVNVPMSYDTLAPLAAVNNANNLPFLSLPVNIQKSGDCYADPWGNTYKVSFSQSAAPQQFAMRISVAFPNRDRYR